MSKDSQSTAPIPELSPIANWLGRDKTWLFFTYILKDNNPLTRELISEYFKINRSADKLIVVEEIGEWSGTLHHHAVVHFNKRIKLRNHNMFNIAIGDQTIHPNVFEFEKTDLNPIINYLLKQDQCPLIIDMNSEVASFKALQKLKNKSSQGITGKTKASEVQDIVAAAKTRKEAYNIVKDVTTVADFQRVKSIIDSSIVDRNEIRSFKDSFRYSRSDYNYPPEILEWFDKVYLTNSKLDRYPVILITGDSRTGKTSAIQALGPRMYFREKVGYKSICDGIPPETKYVMYDDLTTEELDKLGNHKSLLCGMAGGCNLDCKYANSEFTEVNFPSIIIANEQPQWLRKTYWKDNVFWVHVESSLVKAHREPLSYKILNVPSRRCTFTPIPDINPDKVTVPNFPEVSDDL
jgi:hypothetical protein